MPRSNPTDIQHLVERVAIAEQNLLVKKNKSLSRNLRRLLSAKRKIVKQNLFKVPFDQQ